VGYELEVIF